MTSDRRSDADLVRAVGVDLAEDVLADEYPVAEVEAELRNAGAEPEGLGQWGSTLVRDLAKKRRLAWQSEAVKMRETMQSKLAGRQSVALLPRAELLRRLEAARLDPRLSGPVAIAARNLSGEASEDELRQIVEDIEALALLAGKASDRGGDKD